MLNIQELNDYQKVNRFRNYIYNLEGGVDILIL